LAGLYGRCKALIFPGEEDFGIVPLEAMACGKPVIAYGKGGALETVVEGMTGLFFHQQTEESLAGALTKFQSVQFESRAIRNHALGFSRSIFKEKMERFIAMKVAQHRLK
ncbi:MAG: glycosyltransferase, partial [Bacteroidota bacterium]